MPRKARVKSFAGTDYWGMSTCLSPDAWKNPWGGTITGMPRISHGYPWISHGCPRTCFKNTYQCQHFLDSSVWEECFYTCVSHLFWHLLYLVFSVILAKSCTIKQAHTTTVLQPRLTWNTQEKSQVQRLISGALNQCSKVALLTALIHGHSNSLTVMWNDFSESPSSPVIILSQAILLFLF